MPDETVQTCSGQTAGPPAEGVGGYGLVVDLELADGSLKDTFLTSSSITLALQDIFEGTEGTNKCEMM